MRGGFPTKRFFGDKRKGCVSVGCKPIISITSSPGIESPTAKWARAKLAAEGVGDAELINADVGGHIDIDVLE